MATHSSDRLNRNPVPVLITFGIARAGSLYCSLGVFMDGFTRDKTRDRSLDRVARVRWDYVAVRDRFGRRGSQTAARNRGIGRLAHLEAARDVRVGRDR